MDTKPVFHGSDIEKICSYYNLKKENIVKFGANVNPLGLSPKAGRAIAEHVDILSSYPDREYTSLRNTISSYCNIPADFILPGNGSSELISLLIQERAPKHTLILGPTYSEYSRELSFSGSTQEYYHLQESNDFEPDIPDLCVMIDETYVEFAPDINAITAVPLTREFTNLMVLRGVSKFFAAPGMRLGYGITGNMDFLAKMRKKQTPWSLNSLGAFAGEIMLQDEDYIKETRNLILSERDRMIRELKDTDTYKIYPAYANFILLRILKNGLTSYDVFEACIKQGMMIRDCSSFQCLDGEFVRFCIMMPEDNSRLVKVLKSL